MKNIKLLKSHADRLPQCIFWPKELAQVLSTHRREWGMSNIAIEDILEALIKQKLIIRAEFASNKYDAIIRYIRGEHSVEHLALSLQRESFLSHGTALAVHGIAPLGKVIYVNHEQSPKNQSGEITQEGIKLAFRNKQRQSQYILSYRKIQYMLLSGKHTGRAGVTRAKISGRQLDVTDIERTLIDVVVRPAYAGGIENVANAYVKVANKINIDHMIDLLRSIDHVYPYHQSIGFLLERAGRTSKDCDKLSALGQEFDFYLDYKIKKPTFSQKWRLYYPPSLG